MLKLKDRPELFQPWKFSSQSCEAFFRALRAFSYAQSTQVNFTMKELFVSRCKKVDAAIRLTAQGRQDGLVYPRERRAFAMEEPAFHNFQMPSMDEIEATVLRAKRDAENELKDIGKPNKSIFYGNQVKKTFFKGLIVYEKSEERFLFDEKLAKRLFQTKERKSGGRKKKDVPLDESDDCEFAEGLTNSKELNCDDDYDGDVLLNSISDANLVRLYGSSKILLKN